MKYASYLLKQLRRNWVRTGSTVVAISVCIYLFCTLETLDRALRWELNGRSVFRLVTRHSESLLFTLPQSYKERIRRVEGVKSVAGYADFEGVQGLPPPEPRKQFPTFAFEGEEFLAMSPQYLLTPEEKHAFLTDRRGCIVGPDLAEKLGFKLGDIIQLTSLAPAFRNLKPVELVVRGVYRVDYARYPGTTTTALMFNFAYLDEASSGKAGFTAYKVLIADPMKAGEISEAVDALFENSDAPTRTETENAFVATLLSTARNLVELVRSIGLAATFTILLVTANTMGMAVRERRTEIAVLKTLGFTGRLVMALVLSEALILAVSGGVLGVGLCRLTVRAMPRVPFIRDFFVGIPILGLSPLVGWAGLILAVLSGLLAGLGPALGASRAPIAPNLRMI